ncbi:hypothetical protein BEI02_01255 [Elizabethkingia sp. HvH-WGS333]|uniref:hypothetical protein n=1 Tax=Elizabethkingia TaxID=308865 RepID=UPI0007417A29|nr:MULTISPECIES: hypothetical protein [Elizabethkingia]MCL1657787.1 hypothetical protein [Elizabethkingia miricola]OIK48508.1 hypothetical protein BEI02_01255 [Elizabethkingia sp. HvH-WGS333]
MKKKLLSFISLSLLLVSCAQEDNRDNTLAQNTNGNKPVTYADNIPLVPTIFLMETTNHPAELLQGDYISLTYQGRTYKLTLQGDGNLVLYSINKYGEARALWATNTNTSSIGYSRLIAQGDGNLVIYRDRNPVWSSNTANENVIKPHIKLQLYYKSGPFVPSGFRIKFILGGNNRERATIVTVDDNL